MWWLGAKINPQVLDHVLFCHYTVWDGVFNSKAFDVELMAGG